jgi:AraC family transcriptional regulator
MSKRIKMRLGATDRTLTLMEGKSLLLSSADTQWMGIPLELHRMGPREPGESGPIDGELGALVILDGRIEVTVRGGRREVSTVGVPGTVALLDGGHRPHVVRMTGQATALCMNILPSWFNRLGFTGPPERFRLHQPFSPDPTMLALADAMRREVGAGAPSGRLYAESLSLAILSYLVERVPDPPHERARGKLSEAQCRHLRNYTRDHLAADIRLSDLAALVGMSPRHFSKLFHEAFGVSPHRYLLTQRLQEGARRLASDPRADITRIALELGFSSQSHFSTSFRQLFGMSPRQYAASKAGKATNLQFLDDRRQDSEG